MQEMGCLTLEESQNPFKDNSSEIETEEIKGIKPEKNISQMRNSSIETAEIQKNIQKEKAERKKHITSSEVFNIIHNIKENNNNDITENKEQFKFSFSKKDASKYVFKEIESEYSEGEFHIESEFEFQKSTLEESMKRELRSSLNLPKQGTNSTSLLYEGDYFRKHQKNKKSFLYEGSISPIQEEVQSSQQEQTEEQSISQSQREIENSEQQEELEQKSKESIIQNKNEEKTSNNWASINNKNYLNIFKAKNRKFSYLTQPIIASNNSIQGSVQGGHGEMRESYLEANETITESPENGKASPQNLVEKNRGYFNRMQKSPKIHKNSEAITESKPKKRRFEENPISFSQMIANHNEDFNFSGNSVNQKKPARLSFNSNIIQFSKENVMCYEEPFDWIRKEVTYYFPIFDGRLPKRFVIEKNISLNKTNSETNYNLNSSPPPEILPHDNIKAVHFSEMSQKNKNENPASSTSLHNLVFKETDGQPTSNLGEDSSLANPSNNNSTANNIRSTIDTTLNVQYKGIRHVSDNLSENQHNNHGVRKWFPSSSTNLSQKPNHKIAKEESKTSKDQKESNRNHMIGYFNLNIRKGIKSPHSQKKIRTNQINSPNYAKLVSPEHTSANKHQRERDRSFTNLYQSPTNRPIAHPIVPLSFAVQDKTLKKDSVEYNGKEKNRNPSPLSII